MTRLIGLSRFFAIVRIATCFAYRFPILGIMSNIFLLSNSVGMHLNYFSVHRAIDKLKRMALQRLNDEDFESLLQLAMLCENNLIPSKDELLQHSRLLRFAHIPSCPSCFVASNSSWPLSCIGHVLKGSRS